MATTNTATLTMEYEDETTRNINFDDVPSSALSSIKANVLALNATIEDSVTGAAYRDTFVSDGGSPITKISAAQYTVTEANYIFTAD